MHQPALVLLVPLLHLACASSGASPPSTEDVRERTVDSTVSEGPFLLSPYRSDDPHPVQLGRPLLARLGVTIEVAPNRWSRIVDGRRVAAEWGAGEARILVSAPGGGDEVALACVASGLFEGELSLTHEAAESLALDGGLGPATVRIEGEPDPARMARVRVRIPELEVDVPVEAVVLPAGFRQ